MSEPDFSVLYLSGLGVVLSGVVAETSFTRLRATAEATLGKKVRTGLFCPESLLLRPQNALFHSLGVFPHRFRNFFNQVQLGPLLCFRQFIAFFSRGEATLC